MSYTLRRDLGVCLHSSIMPIFFSLLLRVEPLSTFFDNADFFECIIKGRALMIGWPDVSMSIILIISNLIPINKRRIASNPEIFKLEILVQILWLYLQFHRTPV